MLLAWIVCVAVTRPCTGLTRYVCPVTCQCDRLLQSVTCVNYPHDVIPTIPASTKRFTLSNTQLGSLNSDSFAGKNFQKVSHLVLNYCGISDIAKDTFTRLVSLIELHLQGNNLAHGLVFFTFIRHTLFRDRWICHTTN